MVYRIALCDDAPAFLSLLENLVGEWAAARGDEALLTAFASAEELWMDGGETKWDMMLLDIEMSGMDGVTLARDIRRRDEVVQIIFVTGYSEYISDGYEVGALHYLMKPVNRDKLFSVLDRAADKLRKNERTLDLDLGDELVRVPLHQIRYLDVRLNYVTVHAREDYTVKRPLRDFDGALDERFFRVGRGCVINLTCVRRVTRTAAYLIDGTVIPLPRGQYDALNRAIIQRT